MDDDEEGGTCNVCGGLLRYGERHRRCGDAVMAAEAKERERCAALCESTYPGWNHRDATFQKPCFDTPAECAAAIRGLGA